MQHDAHELIRLLIDRLERDMRNSKVNARLVTALYEGDLANQVGRQIQRRGVLTSRFRFVTSANLIGTWKQR